MARYVGPLQTRGEIVATKRAGEYTVISVVANGIPDRFRPGQFIAVAIGGEETAMPLRRAFSIYDVRSAGMYGGTVDFVVSPRGKGTHWLAERRVHDVLDVVGPLGRPFALPRDPVSCLLIGGGYGAAPLFRLAEALQARGCRIDFALGAATNDRLFGVLEAKRLGTTVALTTDDGSFGDRGVVTDAIARIVERARTEVIYACGPMAMLEQVSAIADGFGIPAQIVVEEKMACGIGICMCCVLPVLGENGETVMVRSCTEGPVFAGHSVLFDQIGVGDPEPEPEEVAAP